MKLPNAENAVVEIQKLVDYCLDPDHPRGKHKARVFLSSCGMAAEHADYLRVTLLNAAQSLDAQLGEEDDYGQRYVIDLELHGPTGTAQVQSAGWSGKKKTFQVCFLLRLVGYDHVKT